MKHLIFTQDVYDDDNIVFKKNYSYEVTFEDDTTYMCSHYGIDKSLENKFYAVVNSPTQEVS